MIMKKSLSLPAIGIIITAVVLIAVNEYTENSFLNDYAYLLIVVAMLAGVWLARRGKKSQSAD